MWNKLSIKDKARVMKLAVESGLTNLDKIKEAYNKFAEGGETQLPEVVVTPRVNYTNYTGEETYAPTLEEYKDSRRDAVRANALLDMQNTTAPTIPHLPNWWGRQLKKLTGERYSDDYIIDLFGENKNPNTCMSTVSSKYGRMVPGNLTFRRNASNLGFIEIPESERDHGDIVQTIGRKGIPSHAAMVSGFTRDGKMLVDESHGGITPETIEHDVNYFDTRPELRNKIYYRFVGNKEDNRRWESEYTNKYRKNKFDGTGPSIMNRSMRNNSMFTPTIEVTDEVSTSPNIGVDYNQEATANIIKGILARQAEESRAMQIATDPNYIQKVNRDKADEQVRRTAFTDDKTLNAALNFTSPSQQFGAIVDAIQGEKSYWEGLRDGNSGFVSDEFMKYAPGWGNMFNITGDAAILMSPKGINSLIGLYNNNLDAVAALRHPSYTKIYHGSRKNFKLKDARTASVDDLGLHVAEDRTLSESLIKNNRGDIRGYVMEGWIPKEDAVTLDIGGNGVRQLSTDISYPEKYAKEFIERKVAEGASREAVEAELQKSYNTINHLKEVYPNIPESEYPRISELLEERSRLNGERPHGDALRKKHERLKEINQEANDILSKYGYKVIKYTNRFEHGLSGNDASYIITDPSVIYQPRQLPQINSIDGIESIIPFSIFGNINE